MKEIDIELSLRTTSVSNGSNYSNEYKISPSLFKSTKRSGITSRKSGRSTFLSISALKLSSVS